MAGDAAFTIGEGDYIDAVMAANRRRLASGRYLRRNVIVIAGGSAVLGVIVLVADRDWMPALVTAVCGALGGAVAGALTLWLGFRLLPRRARRLYRQHKTLQQPTTLHWSDDGLLWESESARAVHRWGDLHEWQHAPTITLVYLNDILFHCVPRRALDDVAFADLSRTLAAHVPEHAAPG